MRKSWCLISVFLVLSFSLTTVALAGNLEKNLIGKWQNEKDRAVAEFFPGGVARAQDPHFLMNGTYTIVDENHLRLDWSGIGAIAGPQIYEVYIAGDKMTMINMDNQKTIYKRVKKKR